MRKPDKTPEYRKVDSNEWTSKSLGRIDYRMLSGKSDQKAGLSGNHINRSSMWIDAENDSADFWRLFVGREQELLRVRESLDSGDPAVILGRRGSGKTAAMMALAHENKERYP